MHCGAFRWTGRGLWLGDPPFPIGDSGIRLDPSGLTATRPYGRSVTFPWDDLLQIRVDVEPGRPRSPDLRARWAEAVDALSPLALIDDKVPGWVRLEAIGPDGAADLSASTPPLTPLEVAAVPLVLDAARTRPEVRPAFAAPDSALALLQELSTDAVRSS